MGGNLFKVGRISKERYHEIVASLQPFLDKHFTEKDLGGEFQQHYRIPSAYRSKPDYGDVDVILNATYLQNREWIEPLIKDLGITEVKRVGNVVSTLYMDFQVDFFTVGEGRFESTYNFMSYNILGNLLGRIFHKFNLKYGEDGLKYVLRGFNNHISKEIMLTRDIRKSLDFLELDYMRWVQGFDTLEDIFEYVISCKYFCSNSYLNDYFNVRKRASERPDFNKFLDYLHERNIDKNFPFSKDKSVYIPMIESYFPESKLAKRVKTHQELQIKLQKISEKFNGRVVMSLLNYEGEVLGRFIGMFKSFYGSKFDDLILNSTQEAINNAIINFDEQYFFAK